MMSFRPLLRMQPAASSRREFHPFVHSPKRFPSFFPKRYSYIDFLLYSWGGLLKNEFDGKAAFIGKTQVLEFYGHNDFLTRSQYTGVLSCFVGFFCLLAYLSLAFKKHEQR